MKSSVLDAIINELDTIDDDYTKAGLTFGISRSDKQSLSEEEHWNLTQQRRIESIQSFVNRYGVEQICLDISKVYENLVDSKGDPGVASSDVLEILTICLHSDFGQTSDILFRDFDSSWVADFFSYELTSFWNDKEFFGTRLLLRGIADGAWPKNATSSLAQIFGNLSSISEKDRQEVLRLLLSDRARGITENQPD